MVNDSMVTLWAATSEAYIALARRLGASGVDLKSLRPVIKNEAPTAAQTVHRRTAFELKDAASPRRPILIAGVLLALGGVAYRQITAPITKSNPAPFQALNLKGVPSPAAAALRQAIDAAKAHHR